ncbi:TPA: hypothetical protein I7730_01200 [Vibrio vulnificus]|uniref:Uncharacterized protein n=1 Tax=Vibrio vulnificus TaxID=672 RepID=A0A8H9K5S6_VIBVL|nr:hypothetical protein [Vibrio vulnificus]HAS8538416.1 hypothetical protein [Vibrio vulnificus]
MNSTQIRQDADKLLVDLTGASESCSGITELSSETSKIEEIKFILVSMTMMDEKDLQDDKDDVIPILEAVREYCSFITLKVEELKN